MGDRRGDPGHLEREGGRLPQGSQGADPRSASLDRGHLFGGRLTDPPRTGRSRQTITGIVLAAGASSRIGRPKQLLDLAGKPVLDHVIAAALASPVGEIVVVLGHAAREIADAVPPRGRVRVALNHDFARGQSTSLRAGLRAASADAGAAIVLLGDQPGVRPQAIASVIAAWRGGKGPVVQAAYGGRPGHPTLFDRSVWAALEQVRGDEGARGVLEAHPEWRAVVEIGGAPPDDIDTEADYERVRVAFEAT